MEFGIIDYLLAAIIIAIIPVWGALKFGRLRAAVAEGAGGARVRTYRKTILVEWILVAAVFAVWLGSGRGLETLGLGVRAAPGFWITGALAIGGVVLLLVQASSVVRNREKLEEVRRQLGSLRDLAPHDDNEGRWWVALSVTAGFCEELIYRGFLLAVFAATIGTWPAVVLSSLAFAFAHAYQGPRSAVKTGLVGLVAGVLFVVSGSLWVPIVLHAVVDLTSGHMARHASTLESEAEPAAV
jgi:membrane protease YdiL (CAAX protease family)